MTRPSKCADRIAIGFRRDHDTHHKRTQTGGKVALPQYLDKFGGMNWAGERHPRLEFHKYKDELKDWTNVLFRS